MTTPNPEQTGMSTPPPPSPLSLLGASAQPVVLMVKDKQSGELIPMEYSPEQGGLALGSMNLKYPRGSMTMPIFVLDAVTKSVDVKMGAMNTVQAVAFAAWIDVGELTLAEKDSFVVLNGATDVALIAAPLAGIKRLITSILVNNRDLITQVVTVSLNVSGTRYAYCSVTLATGEALQITAAGGVQIVPATRAHSALTGLTTGDDHTHYMANAIARTVSAVHTLANGLILGDAGAAPAVTGRLQLHGVIPKIHDGTAARRVVLQSDVAPTNLQMMIHNGTIYVPATVSGGASISGSGVVQLDLTASANITGPLAITKGGTGAAMAMTTGGLVYAVNGTQLAVGPNLTQDRVLLGGGGGAATVLAQGNAGNVLIGGTTPPTWRHPFHVQSISNANYGPVAADNGKLFDCTATTVDVLVTLPSAVGNAGLWFTIRRTGVATSQTVIIEGSINGGNGDRIFSQYGWVTVMSNGTVWTVIGCSDYRESRNAATPSTNAMGATGNWVDVSILNLSSGEWELSGVIETALGVGTVGTAIELAISDTARSAGASVLGLVNGDNWIRGGFPTASADLPLSIPAYRYVSVQNTGTSLRLHVRATFSAGTAPSYWARLSARRVG